MSYSVNGTLLNACLFQFLFPLGLSYLLRIRKQLEKNID